MIYSNMQCNTLSARRILQSVEFNLSEQGHRRIRGDVLFENPQRQQRFQNMPLEIDETMQRDRLRGEHCCPRLAFQQTSGTANE